MKQKIVRLSALLGILIFVFIIYRIGPEQIWKNISKISVENFLILVALRILYWLLRTINWKIILEEYQGRTSLFQLFIARMSGHSVSQLTPTAQMGSEATRIFMANCSSRKVSFASVVVDKTVEYMSVVFFTAIGVVTIFFRIPLPGKIKTFLIVGLLIAVLGVIFLFLKQKKGMLGWILDIISKIKIKIPVLERNKDKLKETDVYISDFYSKNRLTFLKAFLLYSLLILLWVTEIHVGLIFIGVTDISFIDSFIVTVLGNLAFVFPFIPGSLGIYEATYIGLFALVGQGADVALTLVLIRRIIALILAGFGLVGMLKPMANNKS